MKNKRVWRTGAQRDADDNKENYAEAVSQLALRRFAIYMRGKEIKYGRGNWRKGIPVEAYTESLVRHLNKFLIEEKDGIVLEADDHLAAMMFNLQGIMHEKEKEKHAQIKSSKKNS